MKIGAMKTELKSYGICTDTFIEKAEFVDALQKARNSTGYVKKALAKQLNYLQFSNAPPDGMHSPRPPPPAPSPSQSDAKSLLTTALQSCPSDRLFQIYDEMFVVTRDIKLWAGIQNEQSHGPVVSRQFLTNDEDKARQVMSRQLRSVLCVERLPSAYRMMLTKELKSLGGLKITCVKQRGESFTYTTGFAKVLKGKNKEILIMDKYKRVRASWKVHRLLNGHFNSLKEGGVNAKPLDAGHTLWDPYSGVVWHLQTPETEEEGNLLKAITTLEPTRFYGLTGYDLLLLVPVGKKIDGNNNKDLFATREEAIMLANGHDVEGKFETFNVSCGHCKKTEFELKHRLKKCVKCQDAFYCSSICQSRDWATHKARCNEASLEKQGRENAIAFYAMTEDEQKQELEKNFDAIFYNWRDEVGLRHGGFIVEAGKGFVKDNF